MTEPRGITRIMLEASVRQCGGYPRVFLWALRDDTRARRFHERAGFRADGTEQPFETAGVPGCAV